MQIKQRIAFLSKLAQVAATPGSPGTPAVAPTPIAGPTLKPAAGSLEGYRGVLPQVIPNIKLTLLSPQDWIFMSRIIGVIDQSLSVLSDNGLNFRSITVGAPSITSANYKNHDALTALMRSAQLLSRYLSVARPKPYSPQEKRSLFTDPLRRDLATKLNIGMVINPIQGTPQDALRREITGWQTIL